MKSSARSDFASKQALQLLLLSIRRFHYKGHKTDAGALTFTSLFALVPLLTVTYAMLSMVPALQSSVVDLQQMMVANLMPASGENLLQYLQEFSQQARKLTLIGLVFLLITAFTMLRSIEMYFNKIWQLPSHRSGVQSFLLYWAVLSLGPVLLGAGLLINSYVASLSLWQSNWVPGIGLKWLNLILPYVASLCAFALLYWAVPNCQVKIKHAFIGGASVALCFELGKQLFAALTTAFPSYQLIYGAFAAVPLFLMWLYLSWILVLWGAECVHLMGNWRHYIQQSGADSDLARWQIRWRIIELLYNSQQQSAGLGIEKLLHLQNNEHNLDQELVYLTGQKILLEKDQQYFLIKDLAHIDLQDLIQDLAVNEWQQESLADTGSNISSREQEISQALLELSNTMQGALNKPVQPS